MSEAGRGELLFTVVVPTRGDPRRLLGFCDSMSRQTLPRGRWDMIVVFDGAPAADVASRLEGLAARAVVPEGRRGPGAARNRGATEARGEILAFTEDDCSPAPDWLERASARLAADPSIDVLVGLTLKPGGRPVHRQSPGAPLYLPTNLFVRRSMFERAGGYCEDYFDPETGVFFREDSDFGFALEATGARVASADDVRVEHPDEHTGFWDPLRWARRHEMDPLLAARHPAGFRERIEVHRLGPFRVRRPIVRLCVAFVVAIALAGVALIAGWPRVAAAMGLIAAAALAVIWAKWRFDLRRLPVLPLVPFVMAGALVRGYARAGRMRERSVARH